MEYIIVCICALLVAALTLFSGFGLGTLLMPVFAVFFPLEAAIAATAIVHLANNIFKLALIGKWADRAVVLRFGVPAIFAAVVGALLLTQMSGVEPIAKYDLFGREAQVTPVKLLIAVVIAVFAGLELWPRFAKLQFGPKYLAIGGVLSGFFGGLSGHQGALRSTFLIRAGLDRDQFVGTASVCSAMVDLVRLAVYAVGIGFFTKEYSQAAGVDVGLIIAGSVAAFCGTFIGSKLVKKITLKTLHVTVGVLLLIVAVVMGAGIV